MTVFYVLDILGTIAFATSGALVAINKKMDPFGVFIISFVTAVGGGTLRDVLIGKQPVIWMNNITYIFLICISFIIAIIFRKKLRYLQKSLFLFDTIGLGIFTITGTEIGINANFHPIISIALGTITACFGGVIRDILCNEVPVLFRKEIYATACILGSIAFIVLSHFNVDQTIIYVSTSLIVIAIRLVAVKYHLSLPTFYSKN
ncbi:MAG: trimeric intracellular cation channel family protein [Lutibacter sp.]|nr:trimeric intracellular cation channel family protein [Lutibacter sp.]MDT8418143.1 trimeric intracellular cation channel family protein [Lutibacter sp.]